MSERSGALPPVAPTVLADAVDALPARLRRKIDDAVATAAAWPVTLADGTTTVRVDDAVTVTLTPIGGVVGTAEQATCSCLLAPRCLHRAAVLARAPIADGGTESADADPTAEAGIDPGVDPGGGAAPDPGPGGTTPALVSAVDDASADPGSGIAGDGTDAGEPGAPALTGPQLLAAAELRQAVISVLEAGAGGSGTVLRAGLLRRAHDARAVGLHRPAAVARRIAARLQAVDQAQSGYRLVDLCADLREILGLLRLIADPGVRPGAVPGLVGTARRPYDLRGSLRLFGLCTEPVVAESGYAGAVTYAVDPNGRVWTVADIAPGGVDRAATAGNATIRLGESALSHRALGRAGLIVSGATASPTGQLGAGRSVRAVTGAGADWADQPLCRLWEQPLREQATRAFAAMADPAGDRTAGSDLVFLTVAVVGARAGDVLVGTPDGALLTLTGPEHPALAYRANLRVLASRPGAEYLLVGRPDPVRPATVHALAVAPANRGAGFALPEGWAGRVDLGYDRLHSSHIPAAAAEVAVEDVAAAVPARVGDPALDLVRRQVERVVSGGRAVPALARSDPRRLRAARLETAALLVDRLDTAARTRPRDAFGRLTGDDGAGFADAWLALAVYVEAASRALTEASWGSPT